MNTDPIGIFDSGVGGLSVLNEIKQLLPTENFVYFADQAHVPYGRRSIDEVREFSKEITMYLLRNRVKLIVLACNTASAAALKYLRKKFPQTPFVGMEPAVKPAAESTLSGVVGVLATPSTFQGELYASVVERFANGVILLQDTCSGLVTQIEKGEIDSDKTRSILESALTPMKENGIDRVVLGCTHYPFVIPLIQEIVGPAVKVIDPSPAIALQTRRVLASQKIVNELDEPGVVKYLSTGKSNFLESLLDKLVGSYNQVQQLYWINGEVKEADQQS